MMQLFTRWFHFKKLSKLPPSKTESWKTFMILSTCWLYSFSWWSLQKSWISYDKLLCNQLWNNGQKSTAKYGRIVKFSLFHNCWKECGFGKNPSIDILCRCFTTANKSSDFCSCEWFRFITPLTLFHLFHSCSVYIEDRQLWNRAHFTFFAIFCSVNNFQLCKCICCTLIFNNFSITQSGSAKQIITYILKLN